MKFIKNFKDVNIADVPLVGGKNASLGQMIRELFSKGIDIPHGFAVTAEAYWYFIESNNLLNDMQNAMSRLKDGSDINILKNVGSEVRSILLSGKIPSDLKKEIEQAYFDLCNFYKQENCDVAVRSSATAEDLPTASFAGQQETFLNICGIDSLMEATKKSIASLFTDRAIVYRIKHGFDHFKVALSVGVQKMVRSDKASAGVLFTLDTETGFKDLIVINSAFGLGEVVVKGEVIPDEFLVFKPTLRNNFDAIIKKQLGSKDVKLIYSDSDDSPTSQIKTSEQEKTSFSLTDQEVLTLAKYSIIIEDHYSHLRGKWSPMDIEWAKDGLDGKLYILQARPETVHAHQTGKDFLKLYALKDGEDKKIVSKLLAKGQSIGNKIVSGKANVVKSVEDIAQVQEGDVLVTQMTDPDWVPAMKKAAGIITDKGGRTCHAAIVSRELGIPAIVGSQDATEKIKTGQDITIDCSRGKTGYVYEGILPFELTDMPIESLKTDSIPTKVMVNISDPDSAFSLSFLPNDGVGLARIEFVISNFIKIHPMALIDLEKIDDENILKKIEHITRAYQDKKRFFVNNLAYGIATIASAFYPKTVIVRFSDFKSNEYRNLIGGIYFEAEEENPMLGLRGASRYYDDSYKPAFSLECEAIKKVRTEMGLDNVKVMVPFVRTVSEAEKVLQEMEKNGLTRGVNGLEIVMMCEIPSNVILIDQFSKLFDGFSIGSNDLTQFTLGVDRDSGILAPLFDERDDAVKKMMALSIEGALRNNRYIGICGQAPSDFPEIAKFLIAQRITSISLNSDAVANFLMLNR